ncbi:hypothetical protein ACHAQA_008274 [Verticillium albo-atrum]
MTVGSTSQPSHPFDARNVNGNTFEGQATINQSNFYGQARDNGRVPIHALPFHGHGSHALVARSDLVDQLDAVLPHNGGGQSAALWGPSRSGKTQLALQYARARSEQPEPCDIFWVDASTTDTFHQGYKRIAERFGFTRHRYADAPFLMKVRHEVEQTQRWLLVLDNANDLSLFGAGHDRTTGVLGFIRKKYRDAAMLETFLPQGPRGTLLWVSRDGAIVGSLVGAQRGVEVGVVEEVEVPGLVAEEA